MSDEVKEILDDTENLLKKITHKICDIFIGASRRKVEKICSNPDNIVHYKEKKGILIEEEKHG